MTTMTSRARLRAAWQQQPVDYLPCSIYFNGNLQVPGYDLRQGSDRLRLQLDLGTEPLVDVGLGSTPDAAVRSKTWVEPGAKADTGTLYKQYDTPAGVLRHAVRLTPEWPHGEDIPWGDFTASHMCEPLVKTPADVEAFRFVHRPPDGSDLDRARPRLEEGLALAATRGLAVRGYAGSGLATLMFVMGAEHMITFAVDHPEAFRELAQIDHRTNLARIRLLGEVGVDILKRFGGYEQTNFLSPAIFRAAVAPLLRPEVEAAHEHGMLIYYRVVSGMKPLLGDIAAAGFDCVEGFEPVLSQCSNADIHAALGGRACVWTGVSSPGHLGQPTPDAARQAVRDAVDTFGRTGFILGVTNSIRNHWPWPNTLAMIEAWKALRAAD